MRAAGFKVEEGLGSLKTAFRATVASKRPGPRIAFLCEYDGLPVYEESSTHPCAFLAICHSGVTLAAAHADVIAPWIAGGARPSILDPFVATRFSNSTDAHVL